MSNAMVTRGEVYVARREVLQWLTVDVGATAMLAGLAFTGLLTHVPLLGLAATVGYLVTKTFLVRACWRLCKTGPLPPPIAFLAALGCAGTAAAAALAYASGKALRPAD